MVITFVAQNFQEREGKKKEKAVLLFGNDNFFFGSDMNANFFLMVESHY